MLLRNSQLRWGMLVRNSSGTGPMVVRNDTDLGDVLLDQKSGSPFTTDLERFRSQGPRIKHLEDLFVTRNRTPLESANISADRDPAVNTAENDEAPSGLRVALRR